MKKRFVGATIGFILGLTLVWSIVALIKKYYRRYV